MRDKALGRKARRALREGETGNEVKANIYICSMITHEKLDFVFSDDFQSINSPANQLACIHLLCTEGEGSLVLEDKCYHFCKNDLLILTQPSQVRNLAAHSDLKIQYFAAPGKYLYSLLPSNNYAIGGRISLRQDPVIHLNEDEVRIFLNDLAHFRERADGVDHPFYQEMMGSLCLTMIYDIFAFHTAQHGAISTTSQQATLLRELMDILETGICKTEREVSYYAHRLHVSPKYLSEVIRRTTGEGVMQLISRYTTPIIQEYLQNEAYSLTQIADEMNFTSLSYFSRYCSKHLGISPSEYRRSLQPHR